MIKDNSTLNRIIHLFQPYRMKVLFAFVFLACFSGVDAGMIYLLQPLIDEGLQQANKEILITGALLVPALFLARGLFSYIAQSMMANVNNTVIYELRNQLFRKMQYLPLNYYEQHPSGSMVAKLLYDTEQLAHSTLDVFAVMVRESLIVIVLLCIMFHASWQLSCIFLVIGPALALIIRRIAKLFQDIAQKLQTNMGMIASQVEQSIHHHKQVLANNAQEQELSAFKLINSQAKQQQNRLALTNAASNPVIQFVASLAIALVLLIASFESIFASLSAGTFITCLTAMGSLLRPLKQLSNVNQTLQKGLIAARSLFALIDVEREHDKGKLSVPKSIDSIEFKALNFTYQGKEKQQIKQLSMSMKRGTSTAIVGHSGSGKSTIANLLLRFYPVERGIDINGVPISQYSLRDLRDNIGYVAQDISLIAGSILDNVTYGYSGEIRKQLLEDALQLSGVNAFSQRLPEGINTYIGIDGKGLSGGQRQRIAIARALLANPQVLVMDEATSALDHLTSQQIIQRVVAHRKHLITLLITHDLSLVQYFDRAFELHQGQLTDFCTEINHLLITTD